MKHDSEVGRRLSDACVKTTVAALALSALAFGLAEKFREARLFEAFANFELARETLDAQLRDLFSDACWQRYARSLVNPVLSGKTTLQILGTIACNAGVQTKVKVGSDVRVVPPDDADFDAPSMSEATPPKGGNTVPAAPAIEIWGSEALADPIENTLETLWNDSLLLSGQSYSGVANEEIYKWRLFRIRLSLKRHMPNAGETAYKLPVTRFAKLRISDLEEIVGQRHVGLSDLDRAIQDTFRPSLPQASLSVRIGTAAQVVSGGVALFAIILAAYVRAAINTGSFSTPGTIFSALLGSRSLEVAALLFICVPAASLIRLCVSCGWPNNAAYALWACTLITIAATVWIVTRVAPATVLFRKWSRA